MQLSDYDIINKLKFGDLEIKNMVEEIPEIEDGCTRDIIKNNSQIQPASVDLRLANKLLKYDSGVNEIDLKDIPEPTVKQEGEELILESGEFALASTKEELYLPRGIAAEVKGRSSIGRSGFHIHTAGWIDPGFEGQITLELVNHTKYPIRLYEDMRICQITFTELKTDAYVPYGDKEDAKYQHQEGPTASNISEDFD